jgi:hypothetical protein
MRQCGSFGRRSKGAEVDAQRSDGGGVKRVGP